MLNLHCNNNDEKKIMQSPRFEPMTYGFKKHRGNHYATTRYKYSIDAKL